MTAESVTASQLFPIQSLVSQPELNSMRRTQVLIYISYIWPRAYPHEHYRNRPRLREEG